MRPTVSGARRRMGTSIGGGAGLFSIIPAGVTILSDVSHQTLPTANSTNDGTNGWQKFVYSDAGPVEVVNYSGPEDAKSVRLTLPSGTDGTSPNQANQFFQYQSSAQFEALGAHRQLYFATTIQTSANYQTHPNAQKFFYPRAATSTTPRQCFYLNRRGYNGTVNQTSWELRFGTQTPGYGEAATALSFEFLNGTWYFIEGLFKASTPGSANGTAEVWCATWTGSSYSARTKILDRTNVRYFGDTEPGYWTSMPFQTVYGGGSTTATPSEEYLYHNRVRIGTGSSV